MYFRVYFYFFFLSQFSFLLFLLVFVLDMYYIACLIQLDFCHGCMDQYSNPSCAFDTWDQQSLCFGSKVICSHDTCQNPEVFRIMQMFRLDKECILSAGGRNQFSPRLIQRRMHCIWQWDGLMLSDEEVKMDCPRHTPHVCTYHSIYSCFSPMQIGYH